MKDETLEQANKLKQEIRVLKELIHSPSLELAPANDAVNKGLLILDKSITSDRIKFMLRMRLKEAEEEYKKL